MAKEIENIQKYNLPRLVGLGYKQGVSCELHCFVDGSSAAYAANVYLKMSDAEQVRVDLLVSKARLSPMKGMTIPRMELMAVLIGTRLLTFVENQLNLTIDKKILWSDSQCVLHWLRTNKKMPVFVENRLREIKSVKKVTFRFIEGKQNPADMGTRPMKWEDFINSENMWFHGPEFLVKKEEQWPIFNMEEVTPEKIQQWESKDTVKQPLYQASLPAVLRTYEAEQQEIPFEKLEKLSNQIGATRLVLKFIKKQIWSKLSSETRSKHPFLGKLLEESEEGDVTEAKETEQAFLYWEKRVQRENFQDVLSSMTKKKKHQLVNQMNLFQDGNGLLRLKGRLEKSSLPYDTIHPVLLPNNHWFTHMVIRAKHEELHHVGTETVLTAIRQKYWIPKGRVTIRKVTYPCVVCKKRSGRPFKLPPMAQLPETRVTRANPFQHTGVDYFGPITIKTTAEHRKVWVALFSCFVTRAVHLEVVSDLTTEQFLNALRRFIARRGKPETLLSDNATQFKLADKTIQEAWTTAIRSEEIMSYCANHQIKWRFITELSPWKGGMYERMVGLIKKVLRQALGRTIPTFETLITFLAEAEAIVNSRPLVKDKDDPATDWQILRPIDFLIPHGKIGTENLQNAEQQKDPDYVPVLDSTGRTLKFWKSSQKYLDKCWDLFEKQYLVSLQERYQFQHRQGRTSSCIPKEGAIVLIHDEQLPRGYWKVGRIVKINFREDNQISSAEVLTPSRKVLSRPLNLLYPLEIDAAEPTSEPKPVVKQEQKKEEVGNRPVTRSMTKRIQTTIASLLRTVPKGLIVLITVLCLFGLTKAQKCTNVTTGITMMDSENCVKQGYVIYRTHKGKMCWQYQDCGHKHLKKNGKCGSNCKCPKWAKGCVFYRKDTAKPLTENYKEVLETELPDVCSFKRSDQCNLDPSYEKFGQIQLLDGSLHYVRQLSVEIQDAERNQYLCKGTGLETGTPEFCEGHQCKEHGTKLCYYPERQHAFFVADDGKILIKAWGTVNATFYGLKSASAQAPSCKNCQISCIQGGVEVTLEEDVGLIEVCSSPVCYQMNSPRNNEKFMLPAEIVMHAHDVQLSVWKHGFLTKQVGTKCQSRPFCETIDCYLCKARIINPQCTPKFVLVVLVMFVCFGLISLVTFIKVFVYLCKGIRYLIWFTKMTSLTIFRCAKRIFTCCKRDRVSENQGENVPIVRRETRRKKKRVYIPRQNIPMSTSVTVAVTITAVFACIIQVQSCAEITILTGKESQCSLNQNGKMECVITDASRIALAPQGQEACLLIQNHGTEPLGTLSVDIQKILMKCQKKNLYYTRSFNMKVESSKRCSDAGSCSGKKCADVNVNSKLEELDGDPNDHPGFTFCADSCGCWGCGCFYCNAACLFYRTFAVPKTPFVYEVFECPSWEFSIRVHMKLELNGKTKERRMELKPGMTKRWNNMKLMLISSTTPPMPMLGYQFLTDGMRTAMLKAAPSGQPVSGLVGELQCASLDHAKDFDCYFQPDMCTCLPQGNRVSCVCNELTLEDFFNKEEYVLPLKSSGATIFTYDRQVYAEFQAFTALELQVSLEGLKISTKVDKNRCSITPKGFSGCYSCITGARLEFTCKTNFGRTVAQVMCGDTGFVSTCTAEGHKDTKVLSFKSANVKEKCVVTCPAGTTTFDLEGTLVFIDKQRLGQISNIISVGKEKNDPGFGLDFSFFKSLFIDNWATTILIICLTVIGVIILACAIKFALLKLFLTVPTRNKHYSKLQ